MALRKIGATNHGRISGPSVLADGLAALNVMVDAWALEKLMMYTTARNVYALVQNQGVYMLGPQGPDWIGPRPMSIYAAGLLVGNTDPTQVYERPLKLLIDAEWAATRLKNLTSTLPTHLYYDQYFNNPNSATSPVGSGNVVLWPTPTQVNSVAIYSPQAVSNFTALTQVIALPPGYGRALPYNLAVEMAAEFDAEPSDVVMGIAMQSKADIKRQNVAGGFGRLDTGLGTQGGGYDWIADEVR